MKIDHITCPTCQEEELYFNIAKMKFENFLFPNGFDAPYEKVSSCGPLIEKIFCLQCEFETKDISQTGWGLNFGDHLTNEQIQSLENALHKIRENIRTSSLF